MKRKKLLAILLAAAMLCQSTVVSLAGAPKAVETTDIAAQAEEILSKTYLEEERTYDGTAESRYAIPDEDLEFVKNLGSAAITVSFKTENTGLMSLAAVNSTTSTNHYISLYISGGNRIGFELRDSEGGNDHRYVDIADVNLADNNWHTLTFIVAENEGYKLYLDQKNVMNVSASATHFVNNMGWEPTSVTFGGANRISGNSYLYTGSIKNAKLYNGAISEEQVIKDHGGAVLEEPVLTYGRSVINGTNEGIVAKDEDAAAVAALTQGSFSFAYKLDNLSNGLNALFALSQKDAENGYGAMYINPANGRIGMEVRDGSGHQFVTAADGAMNNTNWHTVTVTFSGEEVVYYLDGELVGSNSVEGVLTGSTWTPDALSIGGIQRAGSKWAFGGTINSVHVYDYVLNAGEVRQLNRDTKPQDLPEYEEGVVKTEEYGIFDMGDQDAFNYRIPALVTTKDDVVIAAADQRNDHWSDWGDIDTTIRISNDKGQTWSDFNKVIDLKSQPYDTGAQSAFLIDPVMISTESGRVWMLVDMFPESTGFSSISTAGNGFVVAEDGKSYLELSDAQGNKYTLRGSEVYDAAGNKTDYRVDEGSGENAYHNKGDLYDGEEYVGNIYLSSQRAGNDSAPLQILRTCYLWLTYSDDNGQTWSNPVNVSGQVKESWMKFCGTGPGFGIELKNGEHAGRLVFPIYYTNNSGFQSSACIYSDDNGVTWERGISPNDARGEDMGDSQNPEFSQQLTESQIIELNSGNLLQFMRNTGGNGKVAVSRSTDGGETWSAPINTDATEVYCQLSVLHFGVTENGKDRVIMSNPGGSGRNNGTLRIGEVTETEDSFSVQWTESKMFAPGNYAYSCLSDMGEGIMGLLYEKANTIKFTSFNIDFIKSEVNLLNPRITSVSYDVVKETEHKSTLPGDTYMFTANMDQNVIVEGNPQLRFRLNGEARYADYVSGGNNDTAVVFKYVVKDGDEGQIAFRGPKIISDENGSVRNEAGLSVSSTDMEVDLGYIGQDPSDDERDIPLDGVTATAGDYQSGEGPERVLDGDSNTLWHTDWNGGLGREDHWITLNLGKSMLVDGIRYLPRQSSGDNGKITEYKIQVSSDGENWVDAAQGNWNTDAAWKAVSFKAVAAQYVKLISLDAVSDQADNDFASAAELRVTGSEEIPVGPVETDKSDLEVLFAYAGEQMAKDGYTSVIPAVRTALEAKYQEAETILADNTVSQEEVNQVYKELLALVHMLDFIGGDNKPLQTLADEVRDFYLPNIDNYTEETAAALQSAYAKALEVLQDGENALAGDIDAATKALQKAIDELVEEEVKVDKSRLQMLVDQAKATDTSGYTEASVATMQEALALGELVLNTDDVSQGLVDMVADALEAALNGLEVKVPEKEPADKSELLEVYNSVKDTKLDGYTAESVRIFSEALKAAEAVLANDNLTKDDQAVVDKVTAVLRAAYAGLTLEAPSVNKDALKKLIDKSVQYAENEALYTPESYQIFKAAYDAALETYSDETATQDAVDAARATLEAARRTLREIPNKDKLEELLGKIKEVDLSLYTAKTAKAVKAAYAQAVAVFEDENATQAQIDQAVKALEEVTKELKKEDNTAVSGGQKSEDDNKVASDNSGKTTTTNSNNKTVKTGDEAPVMILVIMAALGLAAAVFTKRKRYDV